MDNNNEPCNYCNAPLAEDGECICLKSQQVNAGLTAYIGVTHYAPACDCILTTTFSVPANWADDDCTDIRLVGMHPGRLSSTMVGGRIVITKYAIADAVGIKHQHIASVGGIEIKSR